MDADQNRGTPTRRQVLMTAAAGLGTSGLVACGGGGGGGGVSSGSTSSASSSSSSTSPLLFDTTPPAVNDALLGDIHRRAFTLFWDNTSGALGLMPDRVPSPSAASIAGVGFSLSAFAIGAAQGYVSRAQAAARTLTVLRGLMNTPQGPAVSGVSGYRGFFYHFLDTATGLRSGTSNCLRSIRRS